MRKSIFQNFGCLALLIFGFMSLGISAHAQDYYDQRVYLDQGYYGQAGVYGTPVLVVPRHSTVIVPRRGSNDYLYEYDNVYGSGASAAGRMSRTVVSPPPQLYFRGF